MSILEMLDGQVHDWEAVRFSKAMPIGTLRAEYRSGHDEERVLALMLNSEEARVHALEYDEDRGRLVGMDDQPSTWGLASLLTKLCHPPKK